MQSVSGIGLSVSVSVCSGAETWSSRTSYKKPARTAQGEERLDDHPPRTTAAIYCRRCPASRDCCYISQLNEFAGQQPEQ